MQKKMPFSIMNTSFLFGIPILSLICGVIFYFNFEFQWKFLALFFFFYIATGISITAGYHRLFAHRAYKASPMIRLMFLLFGAASFQNSAMKWCTDHRRHHKEVDKEDDPYSINEGFWWAHMGWILRQKDGKYPTSSPDLEKDLLVVWQDKHYTSIALVMGFVVPTIIGLLLGNAFAGLLFGGLLRILVVHHCTFFINSLCHFFGKQPYTDENSAKDSFVMALFTYGEGYHNFHHKFQGDYRNGIRWYHFDPTKWLIQILHSLGMARNLVKVPEEEIFKAKLRMQMKRAKVKGFVQSMADHEALEQFRTKVEIAQRRFRVLKRDYESKKKELGNRRDEKLQAMRDEMEAARQEFQVNYRSWQVYLKNKMVPPLSKG
ncbi:MAG: acyl-CoA desaturase [Bdellovibrionales bacterium]